LATIGGVPKVVVCDNLKAGVAKPSRYEPGINRTYQDLAEHYGFVVLPARVRKPRDKAKVEVAVLIVQRFVLARLRSRRFFSLHLRQSAIVEDVDMKALRGLDKALFQKLAAGDWIDRHQNLIVIGPTGVGKSWLACALGHKACRDDRSVFYQRVPRLFETLALARGDGRYGRLLKTRARVELLILDDWGLATLTQDQGCDLLEIIDDRQNRGSTIVTSQLPVDHWHEVIANPTVADAILDRLVHNAHRLTLSGDSMRKAAAKGSGA
jgi:DNA replication protein DnaC